MHKKLYFLGFILILFAITIIGCGKFDYGVVDDQYGEPVAEAKVIIGENETNTNDKGSFIFRNLEPGEYVLKIRKDGYRDKNIDIEIQNASTFFGELVLEKID